MRKKATMRMGTTAASAGAIVIGIAVSAGAGPVAAAVAAKVAAPDTVPAQTIIKTNQVAGYVAGPGPHSAKVTVKIPKVTCPSVDAVYAPVAEVDGQDAGFSRAEAVASCDNGTPSYFVESFINDVDSGSLFTVQPNDLVKLSVSETVGGTTVTVTDVTSGETDTVTGPGGGVTSEMVGAVAGNNGSPVDVPSFAPDPFTQASIGGKALGSVSPVEEEMVSGATVRLEPTAITGGNAFKMVFKHN